MHATVEHTIEHYLGDLIAIHRHVGEAVTRHAQDEHLRRIPVAAAVISTADATLQRHLNTLDRHAKTIGGTGFEGALKHSLTAITGFLTGLYGTIRPETASRMLRDDYTGISFVMICTQMLHTTALAVGDNATADLCRSHLSELASTIMAINSALPAAIVADLEVDQVPIANANAADQAAQEHSRAWQQAGQSAPR